MPIFCVVMHTLLDTSHLPGAECVHINSPTTPRFCRVESGEPRLQATLV